MYLLELQGNILFGTDSIVIQHNKESGLKLKEIQKNVVSKTLVTIQILRPNLAAQSRMETEF